MKVYIAAPFFTPDQLDLVLQVELALQSHSIQYFSPRLEGLVSDLTDEEKKTRLKEVYQSNVDNILACNHMIALIDVKDTGTIFEIGYAARLRETLPKRYITTFTNQNKQINVMLMQTVDAHITTIGQIGFTLLELERTGSVPAEFKNFPKDVT